MKTLIQGIFSKRKNLRDLKVFEVVDVSFEKEETQGGTKG